MGFIAPSPVFVQHVVAIIEEHLIITYFFWRFVARAMLACLHLPHTIRTDTDCLFPQAGDRLLQADISETLMCLFALMLTRGTKDPRVSIALSTRFAGFSPPDLFQPFQRLQPQADTNQVSLKVFSPEIATTFLMSHQVINQLLLIPSHVS